MNLAMEPRLLHASRAVRCGLMCSHERRPPRVERLLFMRFESNMTTTRTLDDLYERFNLRLRLDGFVSFTISGY